jgi:hypothetical protein
MDEETRFREAVVRQWAAVFRVAQYLHAKGNCLVQINPLRIRPSFEQRNGYGDDADILLKMVDKERWWKIEVKWKQLEFIDQYPFPTVFLDRIDKSDSAQPDGYYIVNKPMTHAVSVMARTRSSWSPVTTMDTKKGYEFSCYQCPVELTKIVVL